MFLGLLSYFEGGNAPVPGPVLAQAPSGTASSPKRFTVPRDMAIAARRLAGDHDALLLVQIIAINDLLH